MPNLITCVACGRQEVHEARGLGVRCYSKAKRMKALGKFPRTRQKRDRRTYMRAWKRAWRARTGRH